MSRFGAEDSPDMLAIQSDRQLVSDFIIESLLTRARYLWTNIGTRCNPSPDVCVMVYSSASWSTKSCAPAPVSRVLAWQATTQFGTHPLPEDDTKSKRRSCHC